MEVRLLLSAVISVLMISELYAENASKMSSQIDALVSAKLSEQGIQPNKLTSDESFVRRIYLDLAGRIPTFKEVNRFLHSKDNAKRSKLIDELLNSEAYVSHNFNYWADTLRATTRMRFGSGDNYINFIKESIRQNKPYDKFVHELLASNGRLHEHGNGATGYYLRDAGMPLDNMANTMQIFLGTSMVCAQCHDHPFDRWTQMDFYKLAAFTSGIRVNRYGNDKKDERLQYYRGIDKTDRELRRIVQNFSEALFGNVAHTGTGLIRLPHDYDYDDAKPHDVIKAGVPYGEKVTIENPRFEKEVVRKLKKGKNGKVRGGIPGEDINSRETFASWATSKENPMFTKTIVNRMWDKYMGAPLIGDLLNITRKAEGVNKGLTEALVEIMQSVDYDLKKFTRVIVNSKTYQRQAVEADIDGKNYFAGPMLTRLTAEQLWDSLLSLGVENPDMKLPGRSLKSRHTILHETLTELDIEGFKELAETVKDKGKKYLAGMTANSQMNMTMMSMNNQMTSMNKVVNEDKKQFASLQKQIEAAAKRRDRAKVQELRTKISVMRTAMKENERKRNVMKNSTRRDFARASEISSPAPASHFLRRFGQSERLLIDGAVDEASVPQALTFMNGKLEDYITNNTYSYINQNMKKAKTFKQKVDVAFLSILSRLPDKAEQEIFIELFEKDAKQTTKDIVWVLVNSNEFMFKN